MAQSKINRIIWTEPALGDLDAIADYIAIDNARAASSLVTRLFASTERLKQFANLGRSVPELPGLRYRELVVPPCRVVYRVERKTIYIVMVTRGEQLLEEHRLWR